MSAIRGTLKNGQIILDGPPPADWPEGARVVIEPASAGIDGDIPQDDDPESAFDEALRSVEAEKIIEACVMLGVDQDTAMTIVTAVDMSREDGRDELAEHDQDAMALVAFHLDLISEARLHGESRRY